MRTKEEEVIKTFDKLCQRKDKREVFNNILNFMIFCTTIENEVDEDFPKDLKSKMEYKEKFFKGYSTDERKLFGEIITLLGEATTGTDGKPIYYDALGNLFMDSISFNSKKGSNDQHFTPQDVCDLIISMNDYSEGNSVCDPTCGSGRFLLSAAKKNNKLTFFGSDIDLTCVKMCVFNMMINGLKSEIIYGDPLTLASWIIYRTELKHNLPVIRVYKGERPNHFSRIDKENIPKVFKATQLSFEF